VLEGIKAEIGQLGRILMAVNSADAAFMGRAVLPFRVGKKMFHNQSGFRLRVHKGQHCCLLQIFRFGN
jgi:hypothetical protein